MIPSRVEYIVCVDERRKPDSLMPLLRGEIIHSRWMPFRAIFNKGRECAVDAWNFAAAEAKGEVIITVADDYFPQNTGTLQSWNR